MDWTTGYFWAIKIITDFMLGLPSIKNLILVFSLLMLHSDPRKMRQDDNS